jgi:dihydrodipicolinate reductase
MKIVVIGASGRIGERLVRILRQADLRVLEASPTFRVNTITGEGLDEALEDATVVVDVSNSPSQEGPPPCGSSRPRGGGGWRPGRPPGCSCA